MNNIAANTPQRSISPIHILILCSGLAALSWEVVWQLKASLALGVSAWGTALTLAITMGGMSVGSLVMGRILKNKESVKPIRMYGILEIIVGLCGFLLIPAFGLAAQIDSWAYNTYPGTAHIVHILSIVCALGLPTFCLGATLPVIGLASQQANTSIALLYGLNTLGAAAGCLLAAFLFIPVFGVSKAIFFIASINLMVGIVAVLIDKGPFTPEASKTVSNDNLPSRRFSEEFIIVFITGFSTFILEVAWFRSFTAAFFSTTAAFSIMLSAVLISLGCGARLVPLLKKKNVSLGAILAIAGILIIAVTPIIERFDFLAQTQAEQPFMLYFNWLALTLYFVGIPVLCLGVPLPWILDDQVSTKKWGALYGFNAISSVLGALFAGWILLPTIGFAKTSWLTGTLVLVAGLFVLKSSKKNLFKLLLAGMLALGIAIVFETGIGTKRVQLTTTVTSPPKTVLQSYDGPDATVSALEHENGERTLVIDGFVATSQPPSEYEQGFLTLYMEWMGYLPMLMHSDPEDTLVIAFGTGQTANALRKENPVTLDIVDINERVFKLAPFFTFNESVLEDERVNPIVMDGRAYLRRTQNKYDVITLEPMPPTFAGVNALYSKEFYELAHESLREEGVIAQWLPFHIVAPYYSASVAKTFYEVFPNSVLWIDPSSKTGILIGIKDDVIDLTEHFPGFERNEMKRSLSKSEVMGAILLDREGMKIYSDMGTVITDDNQLLAFGEAVNKTHELGVHTDENFQWLDEVITKLEDRKE